jgi:hypothetical protein
MTMTYFAELIGQQPTCWDTYTEALVWIMDSHPGCTIGHPGDIVDGGERTLVWASEVDAEDDDGSNAIAVIRVRGGAQ